MTFGSVFEAKLQRLVHFIYIMKNDGNESKKEYKEIPDLSLILQ